MNLRHVEMWCFVQLRLCDEIKCHRHGWDARVKLNRLWNRVVKVCLAKQCLLWCQSINLSCTLWTQWWNKSFLFSAKSRCMTQHIVSRLYDLGWCKIPPQSIQGRQTYFQHGRQSHNAQCGTCKSTLRHSIGDGIIPPTAAAVGFCVIWPQRQAGERCCHGASVCLDHSNDLQTAARQWLLWYHCFTAMLSSVFPAALQCHASE